MLELHKDKTKAVFHEDADQAIVPVAATCKLYSAAGAELQSATVTISAVGTTTAAGTTASILTLTSAAGVIAGAAYRLTFYGNTYVVVPVKINGSAVTLRETLPEAPPDGSAFAGLRMTATLAAVGSVKPNCMLRWEFDDGTTYRQHQEIADAVRWPFEDVASSADVANALAGYGTTKSDSFCEDVAKATNSRIRQPRSRSPSAAGSIGVWRNVTSSRSETIRPRRARDYAPRLWRICRSHWTASRSLITTTTES